MQLLMPIRVAHTNNEFEVDQDLSVSWNSSVYNVLMLHINVMLTIIPPKPPQYEYFFTDRFNRLQ